MEIAYKVSLCLDVGRVASEAMRVGLKKLQNTNQFKTQGDIMRYIGVTTYAYERNEHRAQDEANMFYRGGG